MKIRINKLELNDQQKTKYYPQIMDILRRRGNPDFASNSNLLNIMKGKAPNILYPVKITFKRNDKYSFILKFSTKQLRQIIKDKKIGDIGPVAIRRKKRELTFSR